MTLCQECGEPFEGRTCQKYCSEYCRNHRTTTSTNRFDVAPLLNLIFQEADECGGLNAVARRIASYLGLKPSAVNRQIHRMKHHKFVNDVIADGYTVALGLHPMLVWPNQWSRVALEEA